MSRGEGSRPEQLQEISGRVPSAPAPHLPDVSSAAPGNPSAKCALRHTTGRPFRVERQT